MNGALDGLRVLDFSTLLPGPLAGLFLAEAGAEVIKIERPGTGEDLRGYTPQWGETSAAYALLNRGKRCVAIDLKDTASRPQLEEMIAGADVVIEQFRPGVMDRLQLGYDDMCALKPDIIYCSITGYGQDGPKRDRAGHDLNYIGDAGLLALGSGPPDQPVVPPALIADIAGGSYPAVINILLALRKRDMGHGGVHLDIAMSESVFPFMFWALAQGQVAGDWPGNAEELLNGGSPRYALYPTSDRQLAAVAAIEDRFWGVFCEAIGLETSLRNDGPDSDATRSGVAAIIQAHPAKHWQGVFDRADCCCSIVQTLGQTMQDPHLRARGIFDRTVTNADGERLIAVPVPVCEPLRSAAKNARAPGMPEKLRTGE